ncbi:MAG: hypothetical protein DRR16_25225 [Candidatus Parabeggiatoa sp. nov. 3]|jgi:hypothetical protein|nr:MAG: hypothetical protein DRR00_07830 [Gammaproteobacteria bacterium]RKZ68270.1 MAG: hypothetical protein DRQ99_04330 [Gammaproteobacteria bacterium]RKZ79711.1 MAG: hypothetical protein DRR16_25225 [Gammaproteobacteria bacterium]
MLEPFRFNSISGRWHGPAGQFIQPPTANDLRAWASSKGWTMTHTTLAGFETWADTFGIKRMKIKPASTQVGLGPYSRYPRVTLWNSNGQRVDGFGQPVAKKSLAAHAPIRL